MTIKGGFYTQSEQIKYPNSMLTAMTEESYLDEIKASSAEEFNDWLIAVKRCQFVSGHQDTVGLMDVATRSSNNVLHSLHNSVPFLNSS